MLITPVKRKVSKIGMKNEPGDVNPVEQQADKVQPSL